MQLSSHDIRMKEFRRAILRGYSEEDVDTFLMHLAATMDQRELEQPPVAVPANGQGTPVASTDPVAAPAAVREAAAHAVARAELQARSLLEAAQQAALTLDHDTRIASETTLDEARANAERGLTNARQRAEEILNEARETQLRASHVETEAGLRLAYVEERLSKKALVLSEEAKRLEALAEWLAQDDLEPETPKPAHAAPVADVVSIQRVAE